MPEKNKEKLLFEQQKEDKNETDQIEQEKLEHEVLHNDEEKNKKDIITGPA